MKINRLFLIVVFFVIFFSSACSSDMLAGSGNIVTENRGVSDFERVILSGVGDLIIQEGEEESLALSTDDNLISHVRTEVKNNTLILSFDDEAGEMGYKPTDGIKFSLVVKDLDRVDISGTGNVLISQLETEKLLVNISEAGNLEIASLTAEELIVHQSGSGTVFLSGKVKGQEVTHNGTGSYHAADLMSQTTIINLSGAGGATVWAVETLDVDISGFGNVVYYGNPHIIQNLSGMGKLVSTIFFDEQNTPMALVRAGAFDMGSDEGDADEKPIHTVMVDEFYMDVYEVTNSQYAICADLGICDPITDTTAFESSYTRSLYYGNPEFADYPAIYANWDEAQQFCEWRGARLPTEAEWGKAARGALEGKTYPWGDEAPKCEDGARNGARFDDGGACNNIDTQRVGSYGPNGYGLYDMAGNVSEWVSDIYDENYYATSPTDNPQGPEGERFAIVRGGSWNTNADHLRISDRLYNPIAGYGLNIGFRCVRRDTSLLPSPTKPSSGSVHGSLSPLRSFVFLR